MGELKYRTLSMMPSRPRSAQTSRMATPTGFAPTSAKFVRCPAATLDRLRGLNEAEIVTLFTPFVPHPPATTLAKNMDPFEPLGRALRRPVRHVPYRLDNGMTETHADFLPSSGAIMIVLCSPENVLSYNSQAFEQQIQFARNITKKIEESKTLAEAPVVVILVTDGAASQTHRDELNDFPAVVMCEDYTPESLKEVARLVFEV